MREKQEKCGNCEPLGAIIYKGSNILNQKVFISYSWSTLEHEEWVINLAERLMSDGIDVIFDKWDLKEGNNKYHFMESMVSSPEINKVLIILDRKYSDKANSKNGGVGTETQIISPKVYNNVSQEKFIPIIAERDDSGKAFIPIFLEGRIYIDLSSDEYFEANYENLIRNIFNRPSLSKPKIGNPPSYLFEETPMNFKTSFILRSFENQVLKNPNRINSIVRDFLDVFFSNLAKFRIDFKTRDKLEIGKLICENINQYTPLRDDFICFFDKVIKLDINFDIDILIRFLEKLPLLTTKENGGWFNYEFDNFRFFIHEIFIYLIAIGLKNENYKFIEDILYSSYFIKSRSNLSNDPKDFSVFYYYLDIIKSYYNKTFSANFYSPMAEMIGKRIPEYITKSILVQADVLCHYIGDLNDIKWFPVTYILDETGRYELYYRMISMRHFQKVKRIFDVATIEEMKEKLIALRENDNKTYTISYSNSFDNVIPLYSAIDVETIGTTK